ncbi:MAG: DegV family protein, partial [Christensenellaceae bacterium]
LVNVSKAVGRKKSIRALVERMEELNIVTESDPVFISHGDCLEEAEFLASLVRQRFGANREILINQIGPVIGTHSGAGTLALFFKGSRR